VLDNQNRNYEALIEVRRSLMEMSSMLQIIQSRAPAEAMGSDDTGAVCVVLGPDGLSRVTIAHTWKSVIPAEELGNHVTEAVMAAYKEQTKAVVASFGPLEELRPVPVSRDEAAAQLERQVAETLEIARFAPVVDPVDTAEAVLRRHSQMQSGGIDPPMPAPDETKPVIVYRAGQRIAAVLIHARWAASTNAALIASEILRVSGVVDDSPDPATEQFLSLLATLQRR